MKTKKYTTLYLPAAGMRTLSGGLLNPDTQTVVAFYWSPEIYAMSAAYTLLFSEKNSNPTYYDVSVRHAMSLRCIKK